MDGVSFSMALRGFPSSDGLLGCSTFVIFQGDVLLPWCWKVDHLRVQILLVSWSASGKFNPTLSDKYLASGVKPSNPHWAKHLTISYWWLYVFLKKVHHKVPLHLPIGFQLKWQRIGGVHVSSLANQNMIVLFVITLITAQVYPYHIPKN